ncbi:MAG: GNAT family N-acetyltransferase [Saprospiraceae bacterium]|nr:GNAT family N-acetyltransferase [Saprospiraceae bacterium]
MPDPPYLLNLLSKLEFICRAAKYEGQVIVGVTVYILPNYYSTKPIAFAYDMGIRYDFQRKGIRKKLIGRLVQYCRENDFDHAFVEAETEDIHAVNFYRSTPVSSELNAVQFTYSFDRIHQYIT